jgi:hypothetical protein
MFDWFIFSCFAQGKPLMTAHKSKTLNPDWSATEIPPVPLTINNPERLRVRFPF